MSDTTTIRKVDLANPSNDAADAIVRLIDEYARIPVISGQPLPDSVRHEIVPGLAAHPTSAVWLAWDGDVAVGVLVAIGGYSTFHAKPVLNVHDVAITPEYQGRGIGSRLFKAAEEYAIENGCAKLTLEVRRDNPRARKLYKRLGYASDHEETATLSWEKKLASSGT